MDPKLLAQLSCIHNILCEIPVMGEGAIKMSDCIKALRCIIQPKLSDKSNDQKENK